MFIYSFYDKNLYTENNFVPKVQTFYKFHWTEEYTMEVHSHSRIEIMYISKGSAEITVNSEKIVLRTGAMVLIDGGFS